jgi:formate hydrogenlyase subunit 6/NADH:ubiquinone oxidoreductase subunit I
MFDMLGNILKNLFSKPATRMYPIEKREPYKDTRGQIGIDIDACIFCGICSKKCPSDAIDVNRNDKSWEIDPYKCIICGVCTEVCPKKCLRTDEEYSPSVYCKEKAKFVQQQKT